MRNDDEEVDFGRCYSGSGARAWRSAVAVAPKWWSGSSPASTTKSLRERQFEQEKRSCASELAEQYSGAELDQQFQQQSKNLLRDLIDQRLMVQKAKDLDIKVETDVVKRLDEIRKEGHFATQEELQAEVEKQGMVWEDFEDNIREAAADAGFDRTRSGLPTWS